MLSATKAVICNRVRYPEFVDPPCLALVYLRLPPSQGLNTTSGNSQMHKFASKKVQAWRKVSDDFVARLRKSETRTLVHAGTLVQRSAGARARAHAVFACSWNAVLCVSPHLSVIPF